MQMRKNTPTDFSSSKLDIMSLTHKISLNIPFETARQAQIACETLKPDPILKATELSVEYLQEDAVLKCNFAGVSDRVIRVAVSNVIDNIKTIIECIDEFDGQENEKPT